MFIPFTVFFPKAQKAIEKQTEFERLQRESPELIPLYDFSCGCDLILHIPKICGHLIDCLKRRDLMENKAVKVRLNGLKSRFK